MQCSQKKEIRAHLMVSGQHTSIDFVYMWLAVVVGTQRARIPFGIVDDLNGAYLPDLTQPRSQTGH